MNRLVLIGNGFDLSHNMKTRYNDFLFYYLKKILDSFFSNLFSIVFKKIIIESFIIYWEIFLR